MKNLFTTILMILIVSIGFGQTTKKYYHNIDAVYGLRVGDVSLYQTDTLISRNEDGYLSYSINNDIYEGEIIGNYLYLIGLSDTIIVDVSNLVNYDSLWTISNDLYEPTENYPFYFKQDSAILFNGMLPIDSFYLTGSKINNDGYSLMLNGAFDFNDGDGYNFGTLAIDTQDVKQGIILTPDIGFINMLANEDVNISGSNINNTANTNIRSSIEGEFGNAVTSLSMEDNQLGLTTYDTTGRYEYGFTAYRNFKSADHFAFDTEHELDITGVFTRNNFLLLQKMYSVSSSENYNISTILIDSTEINFNYDLPQGDNEGLNLQMKLNNNGLTLPITDTLTTLVNGSIYYSDESHTIKSVENGKKGTLLFVSETIYANDAAADLDSNLKSGHGYQVIGNRAVFIKP